MKPFNIDLYAKSAEEALRQIAAATACNEEALRMFAGEQLAKLKRRYKHNGYWNMQPDQKEARQRHHP